jgi:hypothetical protein
MTLSRTLFGAGIGLLALVLTTSTLAAKQGAVLTKDNRDYFGDITADPADGPVTIVVTLPGSPPRPPQPIQIKRANVERVTYFKSNREEFDYRTARAGKLAASHIATARWAMAQNEPEWAQQSLASAKALQPNDPSVQQLERDLNAAKPKPATPPAATQPAQPGTSPATPPVGPAGGGKRPKPAIRMLTADEINELRQLEWKGDKQVTVKIEPDLRKRYMDLAGITNAQAKQMSPQDMAWEIVHKGTPDMKHDLKLITDPQPLRDWRSNINNKIIGTNTGCAAAACHHPQNKAGDFVLFHGNGEAEGLTNFVIVNQFYKDVQRPKEKRPQQYLMIDRTQPQQSLLLLYALPATMTDVPHPEVKGYNGVIRNRGDKNYGTLISFITESLSAVPPDYSEMFDLTAEPKEPEKGKKDAPAKAADAPVKGADAPQRAAGDVPARVPPIGGGPGPNGLPGRQARPPR